MNETYIGKVVQDEDGEMMLEFPVELLKQMGWDEGTLLDWMIDEEEKIILKEAENGRQTEA
jgi:bifunctional DNA-binding transcriptional regulator/antitoxin component of YhaV-PrlF toxin-antitoxin module